LSFGGAFEEVIAHPLATPFAAHDDLQGLRQEALGHVVCVVTLAQFSASRASNRPRSSAHSITTVPGFRFSLHIGCRIPAALNLRLYEQETASRALEEIGFRYSAINAWVQNVDCELFTACQELIVQSVDLARLIGRDILLMQGSQLMLGWLVVVTIASSKKASISASGLDSR
jgi:hypothetical protein